MSSPSLDPIRRPWSFSLRQLFIATFAVAILIVLAQTIPAHLFVGWGILLALLMIVVVTGIASTRANRALPFWECVIAWWCQLFLPYLTLLPSLFSRRGRWSRFSSSYRWWMRDDELIVMCCCSLGLFCLFTFSALRRGHWSTRLLALPLMLVLIAELYAICAGPAVNLDDMIEYWITGDQY